MEYSTVEARFSLPPMRQENLRDEQIEQLLWAAFSPHRCVVRFVEPSERNAIRRVTIKVFVWTGARADEREFEVGGVPVDTLRAPTALAEYVNEVRRHLQQRRVVFGSLSFSQSLAHVREIKSRPVQQTDQRSSPR
jgi:hypothetical protein